MDEQPLGRDALIEELREQVARLTEERDAWVAWRDRMRDTASPSTNKDR